MTSKVTFPAGPAVDITIDGQIISAREGEPLAAVFLRLGDVHTRTSFQSGQHRAPFCMMGVCYECLVHVENVGTTRSCQQAVASGMKVERYDHPKGLK
ncbi:MULTISPECIES: (2Fe-2S)-binding protein [unclassified Mesorhizobium]|uniref:(2Fe-2S)-binding protein n=1 Tax=unclassified Mesorhizobium TaxID=325217 RepID=UPI000FD36CF9|nr:MULTISPECIES: (2Fe-2S)-binding protein [unclassified Mesorhizobium]RUV87569.1 (2Fe-2S)-binding protein [Mesorhizobium sp. M5C.F.Ca.IN.020.14.1.1]RUV13340.1 (2Fe-2S)-binding protein [Mesorhizobium sp. M5C.F.Ca.IN.020.32.2.1]RWG50754.1 MAG: (2Fe-2S)-binding protein [Mesorhizobium sp.]RWH55726.1 MAG: (2Fe-2S)-binding protein [Mesorhizobium sp.]RWI67763.1 MAG: (2Fe-2S)-binding protein [Mesorhizobium sp.]